MHPKLIFTLFFIILFSSVHAQTPITIHPKLIVSQKRLDLTKEYAKRHYGMDTYHLVNPKMIVLHYTATPTLEMSLNVFAPDTVPDHREKIKPFGKVNVGVHFLVDKNGDIYSLLPTTIMGRHAVGYNYTAIGIENVAGSEDGITKEQIEANVQLIRHLLKKHPSIDYLIGHHEYMHIRYPHFKLRIHKDRRYTPPIKIDPGFGFMREVRKRLRLRYRIDLKK